MGLILLQLVLQQVIMFSMALAAGLQQLTFMGVYVVPGEVFVEHNNLLMSFYWHDMTFKPQRIQDNTGKNGRRLR